jgi:hypothetical protein
MHLILVAPGLLAQSQAALAATSSLASLAQLAPTAHVDATGIAAALLDALGAPADTPIAPLAALGAGIDTRTDYVLMADPVLLVADRDDLILVQRIDDLAAAESAALETILNRHFASDGWHFVAARADAWFAQSPRAPAITTTPFDAACAKGVLPYLPRGADGGVWQRWQNEIGMLLHEHPVNLARQAAGRAGVTGIWFWGGGRLSDALALPATVVVAASGRVADVARGVARHAGGSIAALNDSSTPTAVVERTQATSGASATCVVVVDAIATHAAVANFDARWSRPALDLLERRRLDRLTVIADGNGVAARWSATPPTLWRRVTARLHRQPFAVPAATSS